MWYLIKANKSESYHGWTESEAAVDWVNRDRDDNLFWAVEIDEVDGLSNASSLLFHGERRPEDFRH